MKKLFLLLVLGLSVINTEAQWQHKSCPSESGDGIMFIAADGNHVYASVDAFGVYGSSNNGNDWAAANNGISASYFFPLTANGSYVFLGTDAGIYRTNDNGISWSIANNGLSTAFVSCLAHNGPTVYASAGLGHVFYSVNNGLTWTEISNGLPIDISMSNVIFSFTFKDSDIYSGSGEGIYKSTDNGQSWFAVNNGISDFNVVSAMASMGNNLLAGTDNGLYISSDNGNNWTPLDLGIDYLSINAFQKYGSTLFMGTEHGVFRSTNDGLTWDSINTGLTNHNIQTLAINSNYLFANELMTGIWRRTLPEIVGVEENAAGHILSIAPNPSNGKFIISCNKDINSVEMYDVLGKNICLLPVCLKNMILEVDISGYSAGIYLLKVYADNEIITRKVVLE